jgi:hypothetical protein
MEELRLRLLLPSLALIVITTMVPAGLRHPAFHYISANWNTEDFLNNILLYMPMGIALGATSLLRATVYGFSLATLAECLQISYVDRIPSPLDIASNTIGAALGYLVAKAIRRFHHDPTSIPVPRWISAIALVVGIAGAIGLIYRRPVTDFSNWQTDAHLSNGHWNGNLGQLQLYPFTLSEAQISKLSCSAPAAFPGGGLLPTDNQRGIYDALSSQKQLTLVACLTSHDLEQYRSIRIVTFGHGREPNFYLAQFRSSLLFVLRTPAWEPNTTPIYTMSGPVLPANKEVLATAVYDGRVSRLYIDGHLTSQVDLGEARPHLPGRVLSWLPQPLPVREIELGAAEALLAGLLTAGILGCFGVPLSPWPRAWIGVAAGVVVGGIVWIFGVARPRLGMRILLESIIAGLTIAFSVIRSEERLPDDSGSGKESSSPGIPVAAHSPHPVSASPRQ